MSRFSKQTLAEYVDSRLRSIQLANNFDEENGWDQCDVRKPVQLVEYGEFAALNELVEVFNLVLPSSH